MPAINISNSQYAKLCLFAYRHGVNVKEAADLVMERVLKGLNPTKAEVETYLRHRKSRDRRLGRKIEKAMRPELAKLKPVALPLDTPLESSDPIAS